MTAPSVFAGEQTRGDSKECCRLCFFYGSNNPFFHLKGQYISFDPPNLGRIFLFQAPGAPVNQPCCGWQRKKTAISGVYRPAASSFSQEEMTMEFFNSAVEVLQTLVIALGAGLGVWGVINLLEGYGNDNPGANAHVP